MYKANNTRYDPMTKQQQRSAFWTAFMALLALAIGQGAQATGEARNARQAYSSSNMACLVGNDFYAVNFTAIQEGRQKGERTDFTKYCQDIPDIGKTYLSIDLLDRDVRKTPISLRVVKEEFSEEGGRPPQELGTLAETAAKIYPNGTADIAADIKQPGHYALIATIGNEAISEDDRLRIPFTVAVEGAAKVNWMGRITGFIVLTFFGVMGFIGLRTYRAYRPKRRASVGAEA
jgi:hypothetical protein